MKTKMGLRSILNLLTIGLVMLTVGIAGFLIQREITTRHQDLVNRGLTIAAMVPRAASMRSTLKTKRLFGGMLPAFVRHQRSPMWPS